jgi:hypothetical protein
MALLPAVTPSMGQLVPGSLVLHLLPALLVMLVVGALGMLVLAATRLLTDIAGAHACQVRNPIGRESIRS